MRQYQFGMLFITASQLLVFGCSSGGSATGTKKPTEAQTPIDPETGNPPVGTVKDDSGFFIEVLGDNRAFFNMHKGLNTFEEPCKIVAGEVVDCYVEAEEASFFIHDFTLHYHVPSSLCTYVEVSPFYFINRQTRFIPVSLNVFVDRNGNIGTDSNTDGVIDSSLNCAVKSGSPVCCVGKYIQTTYKWDLASNSYSEPTSVEVDRTLAQCLGGPATLTQSANAFGLPISTVQYVKDKGISDEYKVSPLIGHTGSQVAWNVNYFNPAQHGNAPPVAFNYDISNGDGLYIGNPYYRFTCYDSAWENIAEARIQLRDWNTKAAYNDRATNPSNHDETGYESSPFGTKPKNDFEDWYDFQTRSITYPDIDYK
jgi:hypothetical protein